jgi:hypothetical protein
MSQATAIPQMPSAADMRIGENEWDAVYETTCNSRLTLSRCRR